MVLDAEGRSNFQALQNALKAAPTTIDYFAFDLLELDGEDLTQQPLLDRKARLKSLLPARSPRIRYSDDIKGSGEMLLERFCAAGLEGVISKLGNSKYVGARSGSWVKTKCTKRQEFVIAGWTPSDKQRAFRSLVLAVHDGGTLRYAGKVGTGFDTAELEPADENHGSARAEVPDRPRAPRGGPWRALAPPQLVAEIAYTEMTKDGTLRHPSYLGLREDKKPQAVVIETERHAADLPPPAESNVAITNRDRVIYPGIERHQGPARRLLRCGRARSCCRGSAAGRSALSGARRAARRSASSRSTTQAASASRSTTSASSRRTATRSRTSTSTTRTDLLTCVQMGTIEFHGWGARIEDVEKADRLIFDLDPDEGLDFEAVRAAAFQFRDMLKSIGLETFPMLTGGKGVHVIAPLTPKAEWPQVKDFAHRLAEAVAQGDPEHFTAALSQGASARVASSSTTCATSAARPPSCHTARDRVRERLSPPRSRGGK